MSYKVLVTRRYAQSKPYLPQVQFYKGEVISGDDIPPTVLKRALEDETIVKAKKPSVKPAVTKPDTSLESKEGDGAKTKPKATKE